MKKIQFYYLEDGKWLKDVDIYILYSDVYKGPTANIKMTFILWDDDVL